MVGLTKAAAADKRVQAACGTTKDGLADAANLNGVLRIVAPVCCYVGDDIVTAVLDAALAGDIYEPPEV